MTVCWRRGWTWPRCMSISSLSRTSPGGSLASIVKALTLGGRELAVDGVLLIGEHGDYAWNEKEQQLYPRKYFMEQICGVFATSRQGSRQGFHAATGPRRGTTGDRKS